MERGLEPLRLELPPGVGEHRFVEIEPFDIEPGLAQGDEEAAVAAAHLEDRSLQPARLGDVEGDVGAEIGIHHVVQPGRRDSRSVRSRHRPQAARRRFHSRNTGSPSAAMATPAAARMPLEVRSLMMIPAVASTNNSAGSG